VSAALLVTVALAGQLTLTEDEAVRRALEVAPELEVEQRDLEIAQAERARSLSFENPALRVRHNRFDRLFAADEATPLDGAQVHLRWKPPDLDRFGARQARDDKHVEIATLALQKREARVAARVRALLAELDALEGRRAIAVEAVTLAERVSTLSAKKLAVAAATRLEDGLARLDLLEALAERAEVETRLREARRELRVVVGLRDGEDFSLAPRASRCAKPPLDDDALVERATDASLSLAQARAQVEAIEAEARRAVLENVPWIDFVQAGWVAADRNDPDSFALRLGVSLPVFNWKLDELAELRSRKARAQARLTQLSRALRQDVLDTGSELRALSDLVELHQRAADDVLKSAAADTERALELGEASALELALLRARLLRARRAALRATLDCERAAIRLDALTRRATSPQ
jgi:outer membrane protein TolC